jgi:TonB family protein
LGLLALALGAIHMPALAQEPVVLKPSSDWNLDYGETRCRIMRTFGEGDQKTAFYFEQFAPSQYLSWLVAGPLVKRLSGLRHTKVTMGSAGQPFVLDSPFALTFGEFGDAVESIGFKKIDSPEAETDKSAPLGLPEVSVDEGSRIDWIEFSRGKAIYRLETGNLGPVVKAMNTCMENLVTWWGADPAVLRQRQTGPELLNQDEVVRKVVAHYPMKALRQGKQADLMMRVMVEADGTVSKCQISEITSAADFDNEACVVFITAAKFSPAKDAQGRPLPSYYTNRIRYMIP